MSAPIDEARLAKIEEWARDRAALCCGCGGVARVVIPGTTRSLCAACAPNVPGAVLPLASSSADALDLVAEVRRLTAALEIARREGAEAMRAALIARFKGRVEYLRPWAAEDAEDGCHTGAWTEALNAVQFAQEMALPLDAPGGES